MAITGHVEQEYIKKALASGMDLVYGKPLQILDFGELLLELDYDVMIPEHLKKQS